MDEYTDEFMCSGSMDPEIVEQSFKRLLPVWQSKDLTESIRLEDARANLGACISLDSHVQTIRSVWPNAIPVVQPVKKSGGALNATDYSLPMSSLGPALFLPFMRFVEQLIIDERLAPIVVYWSRYTTARFLPSGARYRDLMRDALCVSIFSEDREDPPDEWCFLVESRGLCLILYGQQARHQRGSKRRHLGGGRDYSVLFSNGDKKDEFGEQDEHFPAFGPEEDDSHQET